MSEIATDARLKDLGEILYVDLPDEGKAVRQGEPFYSMESEKDLAHLMRYDSYKKFVIALESWKPRITEIATSHE